MTHADHERHTDTALDDELLVRVTAHANECHGDELRVAVATRTGQRVRHIVGAQLVDLTPRSVELQWVTARGAHRTVLRFASAATDQDHLGVLLRRALHPGIC